MQKRKKKERWVIGWSLDLEWSRRKMASLIQNWPLFDTSCESWFGGFTSFGNSPNLWLRITLWEVLGGAPFSKICAFMARKDPSPFWNLGDLDPLSFFISCDWEMNSSISLADIWEEDDDDDEPNETTILWRSYQIFVVIEWHVLWGGPYGELQSSCGQLWWFVSFWIRATKLGEKRSKQTQWGCRRWGPKNPLSLSLFPSSSVCAVIHKTFSLSSKQWHVISCH